MLLAPKTRHRGRRLPRPDGRTLAVRRFRELQRQFEHELGPLSVVDKVLVDQAVALIVKAESIQTAIVRGEVADADAAIRLLSESRRVLASLKSKAAQNKPAGPTLADYLAQRAAQADEEDTSDESEVAAP
jgi:hypothetical protein